MMVRIAGFDPGNTTGWATVLFDRETKKGTVTMFGTIPKETVWSDLHTVDADIFVVENYIIRSAAAQGGYAHQWNDGFALQVIGGLRTIANQRKIPLITQEPTIKPSAYAMIGAEYKKGKKNMHSMDAIVHIFHYLMKHEGGDPNCLNVALPQGL